MNAITIHVPAVDDVVTLGQRFHCLIVSLSLIIRPKIFDCRSIGCTKAVGGCCEPYIIQEVVKVVCNSPFGTLKYCHGKRPTLKAGFFCWGWLADQANTKWLLLVCSCLRTGSF